MQKPPPKKPENVENERVVEQLKRFVDVIEESSHRFEKLYSSGAQRSIELEEVNARNALQSSEKAALLHSKRLQHAYLGIAVTVLLAGVGFFINGQMEERRYERDAEKAEIQRRFEKLESISESLTEVRKVKDDALIDCGAPSFDARELEHKRLAARTKMVTAFRNSDFYFGPDVRSAADSFTSWESSINDYCSKDLPNDSEWRERHRAIETLARKYFPESIFSQRQAAMR